MKVTILGTGYAYASKCANTFFLLEDQGKYLLVDGGGGNQVLTQIEKSGNRLLDIHEMILTHRHTDHIMGMVWMIRMITQAMARDDYEGEARIYGHDEVIRILREMAEMLFTKREKQFFDTRFFFVEVTDGETREINGREVTFFDIHSTKAKQFGFSMKLSDGSQFTCLGDEPYVEWEKPYVQNCTWLLHEAYCLYSMKEAYRPYEKHHSTAKDACETAERLGIKNLVLYHTEDEHLAERKRLYTEEGKQYFHGNLFVPDDLEEIIIE